MLLGLWLFSIKQYYLEALSVLLQGCIQNKSIKYIQNCMHVLYQQMFGMMPTECFQ